MGIVEDIIAMVAGSMGLFFFVAAAGVVCYFVYKIFDNRYPKITFQVYDQGLERYITQRLNGKKVVPNDLLGLVTGKRELGENIEDFTSVKIMQKKFFGMAASYQENYLAFIVNRKLIPAKYDVNRLAIDPVEIKNGAEVARRYISAEEAVEIQSKTQEPIMIAILTALPVTIIILAFAVAIYLSYMGLSDNLSKVAVLQGQNIAALRDVGIQVGHLINQTRGI